MSFFMFPPLSRDLNLLPCRHSEALARHSRTWCDRPTDALWVPQQGALGQAVWTADHEQ